MVLDENMERIVRIFQKDFHLGYVERDPVKYVKRYPGEVDWAGRLFKYLGLAELDKKSPLGWRPTPLLVDLMNKQPARKCKPSTKPIPVLNKLIIDLLYDAVIGDKSYEVHGSVLNLGFNALQVLGLVRENWEGQLGAMPRLLHLFAEAYYDRLNDEMIKGKYPVFPPDQPRDELVFAPVVCPK
jgi:hypothetical protein